MVATVRASVYTDGMFPLDIEIIKFIYGGEGIRCFGRIVRVGEFTALPP